MRGSKRADEIDEEYKRNITKIKQKKGKKNDKNISSTTTDDVEVQR